MTRGERRPSRPQRRGHEAQVGEWREIDRLSTGCADGHDVLIDITDERVDGARIRVHPVARQELAAAGITVNAICPSAVETERLDHLGFQPDGTVDLHQREQRIKEIGTATPVGRVGRPEDVAEVAAFLAGDAADYITGQSINVTGGGVMH